MARDDLHEALSYISMKSIKTFRVIPIVSLALFALWWLCQAVIHFTHFTPYTNMAIYSSPVGHVAFTLQTVLTFPFQMAAIYPQGHHLQTYLFVALDSCIWGLCVGALFYGVRQISRKHAA